MLTEVQYRLLDFIERYKQSHDGNAPNTVEVAIELKTSKQNIGSWYEKLKQAKYIRIDVVNNRVQHVIIINHNWRFDKPDIMDTNVTRNKRSDKARKEYRSCKK